MKPFTALFGAAAGTHAADQLALATLPLTATLVLGAGPDILGLLVAIQSAAWLLVTLPAGAWADRIAAQLGEPVPLEVIAPMLMVSSRVPAFIDPVVILRGRKLSFKQLANGTVVIGGGHLAMPYRDENRTVLDWTKLATSARTVWELFPAMREATIVRAWAGIEARMPDEIQVVGPSATSEGVFHQFGFSAHGFQLGPATGAVMAELVATGSSNTPLDGLGIERFRHG